MKFIHISDLHIGKRVNEKSLIDEQTHILNQICDITDAQRPDAVLIAGDVYDKAVPSGEAVLLFDDFLTKISSLCGHIFIISGNGSVLEAEPGMESTPETSEVTAGDCLYCQKGHSHSLVNTSETEDLVFYAAVPKQ